MRPPALDPRTKLLLVLSVSSLSIFVGGPLSQLGLILLAWLLATYLGGEPQRMLRRLWRLFWVILPLVFLQSVFASTGTTLLRLGGLSLLTTGGLLSGWLMLTRLAVVLVAASILQTASPRDIVQALIQCRIPYELAFMVMLAARFLPLLSEEVQDSLVALQLRGIEPEKLRLRGRLQIYVYLLLPVAVNTLIRAEQLSLAMELRAFRAFPGRTSYRQLRLQRHDIVWMVCCAATTLAILLWFR